MTASELQNKLIRIRRTIALDLKAAAELDRRAKRKRDNAARLQADAEDIERKLRKAKA